MENSLELSAKHGVGLPIPDEIREAVIRLLIAGVGIVTIADGLKIATDTVTGIREENLDKLPSWRESSKKKLQSFITLCGERLVSEIRDIPLATLPVSMAIGIDKLLLLEGEATVRVDHVHRLEPGRFSSWMGKMLAPTPHQPVIDAQVIDTQHSLAGPKPEELGKPATSPDPGEGASKAGGG